MRAGRAARGSGLETGIIYPGEGDIERLRIVVHSVRV